MKEKEQVLIKSTTLKTNLTLPKEVSEALKSLALAERKAYAVALVNKGWTYQCIANELGISREAVRLYTTKEVSADVMSRVAHLPLPELPTKEVYGTRIKRVKLEPEVLEKLKELHALASKVRGKGKKYRKEAEDFTKLAWEQNQKGVSTYAIAKALGITHGALLFRFVRYGYKTTNGKSRVFRQLSHRQIEGETSEVPSQSL